MSLPWQTLVALLEESYLDMNGVDPGAPTNPSVVNGPQVPASKYTPKIRIFTAADLPSSGFLSSALYAKPTVDVIAHAYRTTGDTHETLAEEIADHFETMELFRGRGDTEGGLYGGSFFIQNEATGAYDGATLNDREKGLFLHPSDLLDGWGDKGDTVGGSCDDFTPYTFNAISVTREESLLTAASLKRLCDERGLVLPARKHDDWEFNGGGFPSFSAALKFDTSQNSNLEGWLSSGSFAAYADYADATRWALAERGSNTPASGAAVSYLSWADVMAGAPAYNTALKWSHATNQAFSSWLASRFVEASSAALRFGPEFGFRQYFPALKTSNYSLFVGNSIDKGWPNFGGTNDYSWVRFSPRDEYFWQEYSSPVLYGSASPGRIQAGESNSDFYRRTCIERLLACRASPKGNLLVPWVNGPGMVVTLNSVGPVNYTVTADDFFVIFKACLLVGCVEIIAFCPGAPFTGWADLDAARLETSKWARRFFGGSRRGSRSRTLSR